MIIGRKRNPFRRVLGAAAWLVTLWLIVTAGAVLAFRWIDPPWTAVMLLEPGPVDTIDFRWVSADSISRSAALAVIAAEDQKFLDHYGFDFDQLQAAVSDYRAGEPLRGASTITQQVARNLFLWKGRSFVRKGLEAYFTVLLELLWPKERILEVYLNIAELGPGIFGVEAAARQYFAAGASGLSREQAALLAAVLPNPARLNASSPSTYVLDRRSAIVRQMRLLEQRGHYIGLHW